MDEVQCSECGRVSGEQHRPYCHRQGIVTPASDYRDHHARVPMPTISEMINQLIEAGWKAKTPTIWKSPTGALYVGPAGAWKIMKQGKDAPQYQAIKSENEHP